MSDTESLASIEIDRLERIALHNKLLQESGLLSAVEDFQAAQSRKTKPRSSKPRPSKAEQEGPIRRSTRLTSTVNMAATSALLSPPSKSPALNIPRDLCSYIKSFLTDRVSDPEDANAIAAVVSGVMEKGGLNLQCLKNSLVMWSDVVWQKVVTELESRELNKVALIETLRVNLMELGDKTQTGNELGHAWVPIIWCVG